MNKILGNEKRTAAVSRMKRGGRSLLSIGGCAVLWIFPFLLWVSVWLWRGVPSVLAWWMIQAYSLLAALLLLILIMTAIVRGVRAGWQSRACIGQGKAGIEIAQADRLYRFGWTAAAALGALLGAWPVLWFAGIGQMAYPADADKTVPAITIVSPFAEETIVGWGGDGLAGNYHAAAPNERWAYDLLAEPAGIGSSRLEDYGIYGMQVFAPASGTVVEAADKEKDHAPGDPHAETLAGNHVYLRLDATGTYLFFAHLMQGSVVVQAGTHVETGDLLGQVGNSGSSSEPHLHLHHQRQNPAETNLFLSEGLPLYFTGGQGPIMPIGGVEIRNGMDMPIGERLEPGQ